MEIMGLSSEYLREGEMIKTCRLSVEDKEVFELLKWLKENDYAKARDAFSKELDYKFTNPNTVDPVVDQGGKYFKTFREGQKRVLLLKLNLQEKPALSSFDFAGVYEKSDTDLPMACLLYNAIFDLSSDLRKECNSADISLLQAYVTTSGGKKTLDGLMSLIPSRIKYGIDRRTYKISL